MKSLAMYLGYRKTEYKERTLEDGTKMPETKGKTHVFFTNEWKGNKLKENGMFVNMFINDKDNIKDLLEKGEIYEIKITDIEKRRCILATNEEDEDEDEDEE